MFIRHHVFWGYSTLSCPRHTWYALFFSFFLNQVFVALRLLSYRGGYTDHMWQYRRPSLALPPFPRLHHWSSEPSLLSAKLLTRGWDTISPSTKDAPFPFVFPKKGSASKKGKRKNGVQSVCGWGKNKALDKRVPSRSLPFTPSLPFAPSRLP